MGYIIWLLATIIGFTWRIQIDDPHSVKPKKPPAHGCIFSFWHAHLLGIAFIFRDRNVSALVSGSRDGRIAARVARLWKHRIIVGSSSRGGSDALRRCSRVLAKNGAIGITPDGPRGPRHKVKSGVAQLSVMTQTPVVILSMSSDRFWQLRSWDQFIIPKPFARVTVTVHAPLHPPSGKYNKKDGEAFRNLIEDTMQQ